MSQPWEQHQAAVGAATDAIGSLQEAISMATERCDTAIGAILASTGSTEVESARNAMAALQQAKAMLDEVFGITEQAVEETLRYGRGF